MYEESEGRIKISVCPDAPGYLQTVVREFVGNDTFKSKEAAINHLKEIHFSDSEIMSIRFIFAPFGYED